jgi:heme/copper-type cytochrome/quinol oxidase subunit 2
MNSPAFRKFAWALVILGAAGLIVTFILSLWPREGVARDFTVVARKFEYSPNILEVKRGDQVTIRLLSQDVHHGMYLDGYQIETSAYPGQDGALHFMADRNGRFAFRCSVTCGAFHPYMIGYLKVTPDYRFLGAALASLGVLGFVLVIVARNAGGKS